MHIGRYNACLAAWVPLWSLDPLHIMASHFLRSGQPTNAWPCRLLPHLRCYMTCIGFLTGGGASFNASVTWHSEVQGCFSQKAMHSTYGGIDNTLRWLSGGLEGFPCSLPEPAWNM